jgi:N-acetylmuramoyl-L-alanine amidase
MQRALTLALALLILPLMCSARPRTNDKPVKSNRIVQTQRFVIMLDAGHGGSEEGARSKTAPIYSEKELTLATTRYLQTYLQQLGHQVILSRDSDRLLALQERANLANQKAVDLFVSIHYNSAPSSQASGVEVFYYRDTAVPIRTKASEALAGYVLNGVIEKTAAVSRGVKHGNFAVIRETKMPAILVEGGFLTNAEERRQVLDPAYQHKIARGIALGIEHYLTDLRVNALP